MSTKNVFVGTTAITKSGTIKIEGKKYELAESFKERFAAIQKKVDLNGRTLLWLTNKDGQLCGFKFQGGFEYKEETPKFGKEGENYLATYVVAIGYPTKPQTTEEEKPLNFNLLCNERKGEKPTSYAVRIWDEEIKSQFLAVTAGEKMPMIAVTIRETSYKGRKYYTLLDFNVIE